MGVLDNFNLKEKLVQRTISIDDNLFEKLENLVPNFNDCSVSKIINASIVDFKDKNKDTIEIGNIGPTSKHSVAFRESILNDLTEMSKRYNAYKYVVMDIAIREGIVVLEEKIRNKK